MADNQNFDQSMLTKLQTLLEIEEIKNLRLRYAQYLDGNRIDEMHEVFTKDATVKVTVGQMNGLDEIKMGLKQAYKDFDRDGRGFYPFMHATVNHNVRLLGTNEARGTCYLIDFETASKVDPNPLLLLGLYSDIYRREDGKWRISSSVLDVTWPNQ